jgi:curved DNA-binding protein CbpA
MRSAYLVLGLPGNATPEEVEATFRKAEKLFTRERLAEEEGALARFGELKTAYQVLRDPQARAAHDRKLQVSTPRTATRARTVIVDADEPAPGRRMLVIGVLLTVGVFGGAAALNRRNAELRKEQAALELEAKKVAAQEAERKREEAERQDAVRAQQAAQAEANERRLAYESRASAANANAVQRAQESNAIYARRAELADQQRREAMRIDDERRAAYEARARVERDKQRVRELCYQQYRRPDC